MTQIELHDITTAVNPESKLLLALAHMCVDREILTPHITNLEEMLSAMEFNPNDLQKAR